MSILVDFTAPGKAVPKRRPRVYGKRAVTPKATEIFEKKIAMFAKKDMLKNGSTIAKGPVAAYIDIHMQIPKRFGKKKKAEMEGTYSMAPGDIDNICKSILDGMNNVVFEDDKQIVKLKASKHWAIEPGVHVVVREAGYI